MPLIIQSTTTKRLYKTTNVCILAFTAIWLILSILQLFNDESIDLVSVYLMLFSALVFVIGVLSALAIPLTNKSQEVSKDEVQQLLLNIDKTDYENGRYESIKPDHNFIVVENFTHEINSFEALMLLEIAKDKGIEVKVTKQGNYFGIDQAPKHLFKDCMDMLWSASVK